MAEVSLQGVTKRFGDTLAVNDVSLDVPDGDFVVLLGPTGAGKTTALRLIAGLEAPDAGAVRIGGRDVTGLAPNARDVAMVFQQYSLYPHLTVAENLAFPLRSPILRTPRAEIERRVAEVADTLQIGHKLANKATALSGGEMQRVSIGRALVRDPAIYLMDEPLSSLDAKLRADLRIELRRIHDEIGATFLYVTHDQVEALTMATRIGVMEAGRVVQFGTPREVYEEPVSLYVATRLGSPRINALPVGLMEGAMGRAPPAARTTAFRPEHVRLTAGDAGTASVEASVRRVEPLGNQTRVHLEVAGHPVVALADAHAPLGGGERVGLAADRLLHFDGTGARVA